MNHVNNIVINNNNEKKEENKEMEEDNKVFSYLNEGVLIKNDQLNQISNQRPTNSKNVLKEENIKRGRKGNKNEYTIHQSKDTSDNKCCVIF